MILADTSVWIDHLRGANTGLAALLEGGRVLTHEFVIGEVPLGSLRQRVLILDAMRNLPRATMAQPNEVLGFIESHRLFGLGIGYIDAHLLASVHLTPGATIWTRDRRLRETAEGLKVAADMER